MQDSRPCSAIRGTRTYLSTCLMLCCLWRERSRTSRIRLRRCRLSHCSIRAPDWIFGAVTRTGDSSSWRYSATTRRTFSGDACSMLRKLTMSVLREVTVRSTISHRCIFSGFLTRICRTCNGILRKEVSYPNTLFGKKLRCRYRMRQFFVSSWN